MLRELLAGGRGDRMDAIVDEFQQPDQCPRRLGRHLARQRRQPHLHALAVDRRQHRPANAFRR